MNIFFSIFPLLFGAMFLFVFGIVAYSFIRAFKQERKNDQSPRLTVDAKVVAKRTNYHRSSSSHMGHTTYFVTFEVESGDRMELTVTGQEYGLLVEGDFGELTFQGTRYLGFQRKVKTYDL